MFGGLLFFLFSMLSLHTFLLSKNFFFLVLFLKHTHTSFALFRQNSSELDSEPIWKFVAYLSSFIPLLYQGGGEFVGYDVRFMSNIFIIVGQLIATVGIIDLGRNFGVAPAKRKIVSKGIYSYINHPIYVGYIVSELGFVIANPRYNALLFALSLCLYFARARKENFLLNQK